MTSSELTATANERIERILSEINESRLKQLFDDPIDRVLEEFHCKWNDPIDHHQFNQIVAEFVEQVYAVALKKVLEGPTAESVAIELLDNHYQGLYATGYTAALMDVNDRDNGGIHVVLAGLAEAIKMIHRQAYIRRVFSYHMYINNWTLQHKITEILLRRYRPYLPESLKNVHPAQVVSQIPAIIQNYTACIGSFERMSR